MKLIVNPHKVELIKDEAVNEREIDISKCVFEFNEDITNDFVKEAYFTFKGETYKKIIVNNECSIPSEVLEEKGTVQIGVVAYLVQDEEEIKRYNPSPAYFDTWTGSLVDNAKNSEPITPSEMEQFEQALNDGLQEVANVDIDISKEEDTTTVSITNRYGETKSESVIDGKDGEDGKDATINGVNTLNMVAGENIELEQDGDTLTISATGGSGGTSDYTELENKPSINNVELNGNKTASDLGLASESDIPDVSDFITKDVDDLTYYTLATDTGATIELSIDSLTYVMTLDLKNSSGTTISTDSIDLPLETMVVGATYDSANKKIVLTLKNGETIDVPVGDLVSGLQSEITSQNKLSSDLVDDTNNTNKFVTASEKTTWSGKQDALVSGTNIKTINNESVLGSGDITISPSKNVAFIGSNYTTDLTLANAQEIIDVMFANNIDTIYLNENKTGYRNGSICFANITPILSSSTTSYIFYVYSQTPNYYFTNIGWGRQDYNVTISWNDNVPVVTAISKNGNGKSSYIRMDGEQQSWTPSTVYSPVPKKYVDDATNGVKTQYTTMPTASSSNLGKIVQYTGTTTSDYINGYYYQVISDGASTPTYSWENIEVQPSSVANVHYIDVNDSTHPFIFSEHELGAYIFPNANDNIYVKGASENTNNMNMFYTKGIILDYFKLYSEATNQEAFAKTNYSRLYKNETGRYTVLLHNIKKNTSSPFGTSDDTSGTEFHFVEPDTTQSITALKTFTVLPQSSVTPTNNNDLVNKNYVDGAIASAITDALGGSY